MWIFVILMVLSAIGYTAVRWAAVPALRRYIGPQFVASFVLLIFAGMWAPPNAFLLLCVAVMIFSTRGRLDAVCRFILLGALIPNSPLPIVIGGTYLIPISTLDMLGVGLLLAVMLKPDRSRVGKVRGWTVDDLLATLLFLALSVAAVRFVDGMNGLLRQMLSQTLLFLLPYLLMRRHLRTMDEYRTIIGCVAVASAMLSVFALYESANGWSLFVSINENLGEQNLGLRNFMIRGNTMRASTTMQGALMLGCYLSVGWVAMACSRGMVRSRLAWIGGCVLVFLGELAAQSRGSMACIALAAAVLLAAYRRPALAMAALAAAGCGAGLLIVAARFSSKIAGFLNISPDQGEGEYDYRQILFRRGMEEGAKHRWTGTDLSSVLARLGDIKQGQGIVDFVNTYLYLYLVTGLIGLTLILLALCGVFRNAISAFRRSDDAGTVDVRAFALASMLVGVVQLSFMSFIDRVPVTFALALVGTRLFVQTQKPGAHRKAPHVGASDDEQENPVAPAGGLTAGAVCRFAA